VPSADLVDSVPSASLADSTRSAELAGSGGSADLTASERSVGPADPVDSSPRPNVSDLVDSPP
jgi:hypothetical protein